MLHTKKCDTLGLILKDKIVMRTVSLFFELVQVSIGNRDALSYVPSSKDWQSLYLIVQKQTLIGVCFNGIKKLPREQLINLPLSLKMHWLALTANIQKRNELMNQRCQQLQDILQEKGFKSCILKGQGVASLYTENLSLLRQPGDIDVWVKGGIASVKELSNKMGQRFCATEQHADLSFFDDVEVEVHFLPTMLRHPFANKRLQKWIAEQEEAQFSNKRSRGLCVPTFEFNLIYLLIHTYRHLFDEGVGLRQVMDYYMLLCSEPIDSVSKKRIIKCLESLYLYDFSAGLMWVMKEVFGLEEQKMLCPPNKRHGSFILKEILLAGNMGHHDERLISMKNSSKLRRFILVNFHTIRLLRYYPHETIFSPFTRIVVWAWRKRHGWI